MRITKLGHACLLVEEGDARLLFDPGAFSSGFETLEGLTAVLVTHQHADHVQASTLRPLLERNPGATLYVDEGTAGELAGEDGIDATVAREGDELQLGGVSVRVVGRDHAVIHPDFPTIPNAGYLVADRFFHPGDALTVPDVPVEILGLPVGAPWLKLSECVDYWRAVAPAMAVPIHDAVLAKPDLYYGFATQLKPTAGDFRVIEDGSAIDV